MCTPLVARVAVACCFGAGTGPGWLHCGLHMGEGRLPDRPMAPSLAWGGGVWLRLVGALPAVLWSWLACVQDACCVRSRCPWVIALLPAPKQHATATRATSGVHSPLQSTPGHVHRVYAANHAAALRRQRRWAARQGRGQTSVRNSASASTGMFIAVQYGKIQKASCTDMFHHFPSTPPCCLSRRSVFLCFSDRDLTGRLCFPCHA